METVLSLCLIVRDEEEMLPGLLASVDGLWDELVAVDTGSTDGTEALLAAAGARMVHRPWDDDFAAARNASLDAATGNWILVLDADERVTPGLAAEIRALLDDPGAGAATLVMRNDLPDGGRRDADLLRLFRNDPSVRYTHRIHEDATASVRSYLARAGLALRRLTGVVQHLGYVREVAADRAKKERDLALLRLLVDEDSDDLYSWFKLLELARFWEDPPLAAATAPEAAAALDRADPAALRRQAWSGELAGLAATGLHRDPAAGLAWLDERAARVAPTAAWHLARANRLEALDRTDDARGAYESCLATAADPAAPLPPARPLLGLARLAAAAGDLAGAHAYALDAVRTAPRDDEALLAAVTFSRLGPGEPALVAFVTEHRRDHPAATEDLARALLAGGSPEHALRVLTDLAALHPSANLGLLVCSLVTGIPVDLAIDIDQQAADAALQDWLRVVWRARRVEDMNAVADNVPAIVEAFPWIPDFLREETQRLSPTT
ncbi:MAG: glycosyltransferase family 2 protein [bacterium]|nr:glycosyltransferase family 2 protein [bacterium]